MFNQYPATFEANGASEQLPDDIRTCFLFPMNLFPDTQTGSRCRGTTVEVTASQRKRVRDAMGSIPWIDTSSEPFQWVRLAIIGSGCSLRSD